MADAQRLGGQAAGGLAPEERPAPFSPAGFLIMVLAMAAEAVALYVLLKPSPIPVVTQATRGEAAPTHTAAELMAPTVIIPEVVASVPVREGGTELRTAVLSVAVKLGKAEGRSEEDLDLRYLEKEYVPKVQALVPAFRHELVTMASSRSFFELRRPETQAKMLDDLRKKMNDALRAHGIEPRVRELYWNSFHFD